MFDALIQSILTKAGSCKRQPFIIAISGFGGSGKSTLAVRIRNVLKDANVVCIDSFVTDHLCERSEDWQNFDRARFQKEVLIPAVKNMPVSYGVYNWQKNGIFEKESLSLKQFLIVEGCSILHPGLLPYYDFSVWLGISLKEATMRGIQRDKTHGCDSDWIDRWDIWSKNEQDFFKKYSPAASANFIYKE